MIEEKSGEEPEHDHRKPILYAMTACAAAALLVTVTQKYGDALPFPGKTKEQTVAVAGNVQGEKTQTAESAAEASAAEEGNTGKILRHRKAQERNWKRKMRAGARQ